MGAVLKRCRSRLGFVPRKTYLVFGRQQARRDEIPVCFCISSLIQGPCGGFSRIRFDIVVVEACFQLSGDTLRGAYQTNQPRSTQPLNISNREPLHRRDDVGHIVTALSQSRAYQSFK